MRYILTTFTALLFIGCNSNTTNIERPSLDTTESVVYICNEGNFMNGNASLSRYEIGSKKIYNQAFYNTNGFPLGDVLQSMTVIDGVGYLVVNNSGKVVLVDPKNCKYIQTIKGLVSPRYVEKIDENRLYISDLYGAAIAIVNPQTLQITGYVKAGGSTEQMVRYNDYVFVCSWSFNNQVYRVDTKIDKIIDSITVNKQPNSLVLDKNNKLWVLSDGAYKGSPYGEQNAALTRIDAATFTVEQVFEFTDLELAPSEITISPDKDYIYYISGNHNSSNGIFRLGVNEKSLSDNAFIKSDGALLYALGVSPFTGEIYVSDAVDYMQRGTVYIYTKEGVNTNKFKVDIIPGSFCFFN